MPRKTTKGKETKGEKKWMRGKPNLKLQKEAEAAIREAADPAEVASLLRSDPSILVRLFERRNTRVYKQIDLQMEARVKVAAALHQMEDALTVIPPQLREDLDCAKEFVSTCPSLTRFVDEPFRNNKDFYLRLSKIPLKYAGPSIRDNEELVLSAIQKDSSAMEFASDRLKARKKFILRALQVCAYGTQTEIVKNMSPSLLKDKEVLLEVVRFSPEEVIAELPLDVRDDSSLMAEVVQRKRKTLKYCSERVRADKQVVLRAVECCMEALNYASRELQHDEEVLDKTFEKKGCYDFVPRFSAFSEELQKNRGFILRRLNAPPPPGERSVINKKYPTVAMNELLADRQFLLTALERHPHLLRDLPKGSHNSDKWLAEQIVPKHPSLYYYFLANVRRDVKIARKAIELQANNFQYAPKVIRNNVEFAKMAIAAQLDMFSFAGPLCKNDRDLVLDVVNRNGTMLKYASDELQSDKDIVLAAVRNNIHALFHAKVVDKDISLAAVKTGERLYMFSHRLIVDKEVATAFVLSHPPYDTRLTSLVADDRDIMTAAIRRNAEYYNHCSDSLRNDPEIGSLVLVSTCSERLCGSVFRAFSSSYPSWLKLWTTFSRCLFTVQTDNKVVLESSRTKREFEEVSMMIRGWIEVFVMDKMLWEFLPRDIVFEICAAAWMEQCESSFKAMKK